MNPTEEQIIVSNKHPFYRKKGQRCPNCGSTEETLFVIKDTIAVWCDGCQQDKGKDRFREYNTDKQDEG